MAGSRLARSCSTLSSSRSSRGERWPVAGEVMSASEPKPGKIYATAEQKKTLMAIYEADNYPDSSTLEQVAENED